MTLKAKKAVALVPRPATTSRVERVVILRMKIVIAPRAEKATIALGAGTITILGVRKVATVPEQRQ